MWTAIWTVAIFVLVLFHGDTILAFAADQLRERRTHRLQIEHERTKQTLTAQRRDAIVWHQLDGTDQHSTTPPADHTRLVESPQPPSGSRHY
jgi:hypothetical protein